MKQVLHIFAKDTRHQWIEILVSFTFLALLAVTYHQRWLVTPYGGAVSLSPGGLLSNGTYLLTVIVPLSWWLLISTLVHQENLPGDRQFWLTRPYEWKKLLAAKLMFLILFIFVPMLLAQCFMLSQAGFQPIASFARILLNLLFLMCILVLPIVALSTVTRNFGQLALALLGGTVLIITTQLLTQYAPEDRVAVRYANSIGFTIVISLCLFVVALQYARRKTRVSWILLAGVLLVVFGTSAMDGAPDDASMDRRYAPQSQTVAGVQLTYHQDEQEGVGPSAFVARTNDRIGISIPLQVSGVVNGTIVTPDFLKVTLESPGGSRWTSVWQAVSMDRFFPGQEKTAEARFTMPRALFDTFKGKPLNVKVVFALTQTKAVKVTRLPLGTGDFTVEGLGICTPLTGFLERPAEFSGLMCRAPLREPELTLVQTMWFDDSCSKTSDSNQGIQTAAWVGSVDPEIAEFGIGPVWSTHIDFTNQFNAVNNKVGPRQLCPGTPVTFTQYKLMTRAQAGFSVNGFELPELNHPEFRY